MSSLASSSTLHRIAWNTCFLVIFVSAFILSGTERSPMALDPSWNAVLEYAALHHWQFGTQIVFTYGPLGYLAATTSLGHLLASRIAFALFWSLVVALTALRLAKRLPPWASVALIVWLVAFPLAEGLDQTAFWVLASGTLLLLFDAECERWQYPIYLLAFILPALIKFSFFTAGGVSLLLVAVCWSCQRKFRQAAMLVVAVSAGFMLCWAACGQSIHDLPAWIHRGLQLEAGYSASMNLTPNSAVLLCALAGLALLAGGVLALLFRNRRSGIAWAMAITLAQYSFLAWKEGFTRAGDWHAYVFLWYLPLGMSFFLLRDSPFASGHKARRAFACAFASSMVIALAGSHFQIPGFAWNQAANLPRRIANHAAQIGRILGGRPQDLYAQSRDPHTFPAPTLEHARDVIGDESVDVMNYLQQAAIANELNYEPRPVFQGFVAYTPALQRLNREYFEGSQRPRYVMLDQQSTDRRFPALEDSAALNYVLDNYVPVARDGNFVILRLACAVRLELTPVYDSVVRFGDSIDLRPWSSGRLFMTADIDPSLMGRALTLLYQPAPLSIRVSGGESERSYRLVASMARQPFLISPVLDSNFDVMNLFTSQPGKTADHVIFERPAHAAWEFRDSFHVRLFTAPTFPLATKALPPSRILADIQDRVFWPVPESVASASRARLTLIHATAAVVMAAPSKVVLKIPPESTSFSGYFGFPAHNSAETARPVRIFIEAEDNQGRSQVKMDRTLDPAALPSGGNRFPFRVAIDAGSEQTLTLKTDSARVADDGNAVSFWSNCRFDSPAGPQ